MGNILNQKKSTKKQLHASRKRKCEAMRAFNKKKTNKTPQDPVVGNTDIQHVTQKKDNLECKTKQEEIAKKPEEIDETVESADDTKPKLFESGNDGCEIQSNEELWVVRRQLCRGCHSDGAFWNLRTTTEGDTYGDLLQTYFNIQLCPVAEDEHALSAICTLCAARLREARAFSAQAHAAEEHFTRLYKQNRVRASALVDEVDIRKEVPKIKKEVDDFEIICDDEPDTANSNLDNPESSIDELVPTLKNDKKTQEHCKEPASKNEFRLLPSDCERVGKLFKCLHTHCGDKLYTKKGICGHVKNMHLEFRKNCPRCHETFTTLWDFKCHVKDCHTIISSSDFERVENLYKCTHCEKQFPQYYKIRKHVMYKHLKIPRFTCPNCDKTFNGIATFNKHKLEAHSIDTRIKCNACDWFTYHQSALNKHKDVFHMLGVKLFCKDCDYSTYCHRTMKKHAVKHTTIKKHHCKFCKKSFARKGTLQYHERIHTGDKRKVCNVCGEAFVQRASLKYHMEKHHPEVRD